MHIELHHKLSAIYLSVTYCDKILQNLWENSYTRTLKYCFSTFVFSSGLTFSIFQFDSKRQWASCKLLFFTGYGKSWSETVIANLNDNEQLFVDILLSSEMIPKTLLYRMNSWTASIVWPAYHCDLLRVHVIHSSTRWQRHGVWT